MHGLKFNQPLMQITFSTKSRSCSFLGREWQTQLNRGNDQFSNEDALRLHYSDTSLSKRPIELNRTTVAMAEEVNYASVVFKTNTNSPPEGKFSFL